MRTILPHVRLAGLTIALGSLSLASTAGAQGVSEGALAEGLFRSARALVAAGKFAEACPKFAESQRIDPKLGTLMNLALCHEKEGRTASAWAEYTAAAQLAARAGQAERETVARASAAGLEPALPKIVIRHDAGDGVSIKLDGEALGEAVLGTPFPIDPGPHEIVASAAGRKTFSQTVTITSGAGEKSISIPKLDVEGVSALPEAPPVPPPVPVTHDVPYGHRTLGYAFLGGGALAVIAGGISGIVAFNKKSAAESQCSATVCTQAGLDDLSSLKAAEAFSTLAIAAGLASAGAGLVFVLMSGTHTEPGAAPVALRVSPIVAPRTEGVSIAFSF